MINKCFALLLLFVISMAGAKGKLPVNAVERKERFPLLAVIESENIELYGVNPYGYVLYQNGRGTYFEWPGLTPRGIAPEMKYFDFDGDGEKELAVILYVASGTGFALMDLHILTIDQSEDLKPVYTDFALRGGEAQSWLPKDLTVITDKLQEPSEKIGFGDIVYFEFEGDTIQTTIAIGLWHEGWRVLDFVGEVQAEVTFEGKEFALKNYTFTLYEDENN